MTARSPRTGSPTACAEPPRTASSTTPASRASAMRRTRARRERVSATGCNQASERSGHQEVSAIGRLIGMPSTTIKVDKAVRDRLAAVAEARGMTMGALLDVESHRLEIEQRWTEIEAGCERLQREDPRGWQEYVAELQRLSVGEADPSSSEEWP